MSNTSQTSASGQETEPRCFHCGQAIRLGVPPTVQVDGQARPMCCIGCQAVSQAIIDGGLQDYYRHREAFPDGVAEDVQAEIAALGLYDHPDFQASFVRPAADGEREADLILEGINCAACVWLNERHLRSLQGVSAVQVNYATRRARVRWHEGQIQLSTILQAVSAIGYRAYPFDPARFEDVARLERQKALRRLFVAGFGMMQVMMYAYPAYIAADGEMSAEASGIMRWASLVLTLPVITYSAAPFFQRAWAGLKRFHFGMDFPVALGIGLSFLASVWATVVGEGSVYFDSVTMFVFFLLGGRYLELLARQRAGRGGESLGRLVPLFATRVSVAGVVEEQVPVSALVAGDRFLIRPGEVIVADGVVLTGQGEVDESWLTGEGAPVTKEPGSQVLAGSVNGSGSLTIEAALTGAATRFASIRRLMERAAEDRPEIVALADRVARKFTWVLLALAVVTLLWWWHLNAANALPVFVSVLVVSCPCALSLATPVSMTVAMHLLARHGVLVTRAHAIETLARANHFVFDKTGTLTTGKLKVGDIACSPGRFAEHVLSIAAALELHSEHSIARAICANVLLPSSAEDVRVLPGQGVEGTVLGVRYFIGRERFVESRIGCTKPVCLGVNEPGTRVFLASESEWQAGFSFADEVRCSASTLMRLLQDAQCKVSVLSGDSRSAVLLLAKTLDIGDAHAELLPEEKLVKMQGYQATGKVVAMVGDGINDAPVLAQAHVSVAMAGGTELARNQADILLLNDDLARLAWARQVSVRVMTIIKQNLFWALFYNIVAIPAAMAGLVSPWLAGLGMGLSSVLVVVNALRISRIGESQWKAVSTY